MKKYNISEFTKGWFVGSFSPTIVDTTDVEVAIKTYSAGDYESAHYHKIATEITVITKGTVKMNGIEYSEGDIIVINPNEPTDFLSVTDSQNTVVKIPGAKNDKYIVE